MLQFTYANFVVHYMYISINVSNLALVGNNMCLLLGAPDKRDRLPSDRTSATCNQYHYDFIV
jgi:hypothetical protein